VQRVWQRFQIDFVFVEDLDIRVIESAGVIPREDAGIYLTAKQGNVQCFVSSNYKLIRTLVEQTQEFECLTPEEFLQKYGIP